MADTDTVLRFGRQLAEFGKPGQQFFLFGDFGFEFFLNGRLRIDVDITVVAVYGNKFAGFDLFKQSFDFGDDRNVERLGDDGDVHGRRTVFDNQTADFVIVVVHEVGGAHGLSHDNNITPVTDFADILKIPA